jgi:PAS domain S-box-containing protein
MSGAALNQSNFSASNREGDKLIMESSKFRVPISEIDPRKALYELMSYQEELEKQNKELEEARKTNELLLEKYTMLYDYAPSGYLTLDRSGIILELNLYTLTYLYKDRAQLINTDFRQYISADSCPLFDKFILNIFQDINKITCEVKLSDHRDSPVYLHLEGIASEDGRNCFISMVDITILKRMEYSLMLSKKEFQSYFENGTVGMSVSSPEKGWIELNQKFCQMLGYTKNELIGINWMNLSHPEDLSANLELYQQALDGKLDRYQMDKRFIRKDGTILYVTLSVAVQRDEDRTIHHLLASYVDITDRVMAVESLKETEERYKVLFEDSPNAIILAEIKSGLIIDANHAASKLLGRSIEQIIGMHHSEIHPLRNLEHVKTVFQERAKKFRQSANFQPVEINVLRLDGTEVPVEFLDNIISIKGKRVFQGIFHDITARKQAEEALRKSEARLKEINKSDWIWEVDKNGVYTYTSQIGIDYFGESEKDIIGKTPFDFMPPDEARKIAAIFSEIAANKAPIKNLENWNIKKNGELCCILTNGMPILDEKGNLEGYCGVDKDITSYRQTIDNLQQRLAEFEKYNLVS